MSGRGGANFKGNPEETERKYQKVRQLQLGGEYLKDACVLAGISPVYYRRIMKRKGDEPIAGNGDRARKIWGDDIEAGNAISPRESKAVFEQFEKHDTFCHTASLNLGGPGLPSMQLGSFNRSGTKKINQRKTAPAATIQARRSDPNGRPLPGRGPRELE